MTIGIIGAMEEEVTQLKQAMQIEETREAIEEYKNEPLF